MDNMDHNGSIFKLERSDTGVSDLGILPNEEFSTFLQENNSSFSEKFDNEALSEILSSNHGDGDHLLKRPVWVGNGTGNSYIKSEGCYNNQKIIHDGNKFLVVSPSNSYDFQDHIIIESSPENLMSINEAEEFVPLPELSPDDEPDTNSFGCANPSLSLQGWAGDWNFKLILKSREYNNKWCHSEELGMLFSSINTAVPIDITVDNWLPGSYCNITPVFTEGEFRLLPVPRCYNHAQKDSSARADHIVQVENLEAVYYKSCKNRYTVDIPIGLPPPGESTKQILVKVGCWNTCVGGPCRKPFCLIFTLFSRNHEEIGRHILNIKICSCPKRDLDNTLKNALRKEGIPIPQNMLKKKHSPSKKIKLGKKVISQNKRMKMEQNETGVPINISLYENMLIPSRFKPQIEEFIHMLISKEYIVKYCPNVLASNGL